MKVQERSKQEIEAKLSKMGDYVKIDYLQRALASGLDFETRKFVLVTLSKLYDGRAMHMEAAKHMKNAAEINTTFKGKINDFMKAVELYIKGGSYQDADFVFAQALALGNEREKLELKQTFKSYYLNQAKAYSTGDRRSLAKKVYEKLLTLDLNADEKKQVQQQLLALYEKLGNIRDFYRLKDTMNGPTSIQPQRGR